MSFAGRRILIVGTGLTELAGLAFREAALQTTGIERLQARWAFGEAPDLILIEAGAFEPEALSAAIAALGAGSSPPPALLTGDHLPAGLVRNLMRLPRSDVLEAPFTAADLVAAAAPLVSPLAAPTLNAPSRCWTIMGAVGGAGATTLAIETACALAQRLPGPRRVCLIDLNLADGAAAAYLGAPANMLLSRASQAADRIDPQLLDAFVFGAPGGVDLLASARDPHAYDTTSADAVLRLLEVACQGSRSSRPMRLTKALTTTQASRRKTLCSSRCGIPSCWTGLSGASTWSGLRTPRQRRRCPSR